MKSVKSIKYYSIFLGLCIIGLFCGCGPEAQEPKKNYSDEINIRYMGTDNGQPSEIWPDTNLKKRFAEYWYRRFVGEVDESWTMEAPHFQFMADFQKYRNYLARASARAPIDIEIKEIKLVSGYKYLISCRMTLTRSGKEHSVILGDRWVFVDNQWFHILYDPLVFPFTDS